MRTVIKNSFSFATMLFCWLAILVPQLQATELGPGKHMISCVENPAVRYNLIIPATYNPQAPYGAPLFIAMVPAEGSGTFRVESWAASYGIITIGVYNDGKGNDGRDMSEMHRMCVRDVSNRLKIHPHLRFTIGVSGSAARGMVIAAADGDHYAGCFMQAHSGILDGLPRHIAVAFAHGENDQTHSINSAKANAATLKNRGNPVQTYWHAGGHDGTDRANREEGYAAHQRMRTWMLWTAKLSHPKIEIDERRYYANQLVEQIREQTTGKSMAEIDAVLASIQTVEPALKIREVLLAMAEAKASALWRAYEAADNDIDRVCALVDLLGEPMIQGHDKHKEAGVLLRDLERGDRALRGESQAWRKYVAARYQENAMEPGDQKTLQACAAAYMDISRRHKDTKAGQAATVALERLRAAHE